MRESGSKVKKRAQGAGRRSPRVAHVRTSDTRSPPAHRWRPRPVLRLRGLRLRQRLRQWRRWHAARRWQAKAMAREMRGRGGHWQQLRTALCEQERRMRLQLQWRWRWRRQ